MTYLIEVSFTYTKNGVRVGAVTTIENSTPAGSDQLRAVALAQEVLAPKIEERYDVERVVITGLRDVEAVQV